MIAVVVWEVLVIYYCESAIEVVVLFCDMPCLVQEADMDPTGEAAQKTQQLLTYYELDLGLNHVVRKYTEQLEEHANFLISGWRAVSCLFACWFVSPVFWHSVVRCPSLNVR